MGAASATTESAADASSSDRGTLMYSRGPCARENLLAVRAMPRPLPSIWRESGDASTIVAFFTQRFLSRGVYEVEGRTLILTRAELGGADHLLVPLGVVLGAGGADRGPLLVHFFDLQGARR